MSDETPDPIIADPQNPSPDFEKLLAGLEEKLAAKLENSITGAIGRVAKQNKEQQAKLEARITELSAPREQPEVPDPQPATPPKPELDPAIAAMQKQVLALQQQVTDAQKVADEERVRGTRIANESALISKLQDRVTNPRHFLQIAQADGSIEYINGQFVRKETDQFGNEKYISVLEQSNGTDFVDRLLGGTDYNYFAKPRPGTGLGTSAGKSAPNLGKSKFFGETPVSNAQLSKAAIDGGIDSIIADLESTAK